MSKYVKVENGVVVQQQPYEETGFILCDDSVLPGYLYDGTTFTAPSPDPITVEQVKKEANRRIAASGHDWMIIRSISDGTPVPQSILTYASNIRSDASNLELMNPIPLNYRDDVHWTPNPQ